MTNNVSPYLYQGSRPMIGAAAVAPIPKGVPAPVPRAKPGRKPGYKVTPKPAPVPPPPPPVPEILAPNTLPKTAVFNVLRAIMPEEQARKLAGYSDATSLNKPTVRQYEGTVSEIRDKIQNDPDLGFLRQLQFYKDVRDDVEAKLGDRVTAAKQIDAIVGNNAPQRVEVSERRTLVAAVQMVHKISGESGMSPMQLKQMLMASGNKIITEEIIDEQSNPDQEGKE